VSPHNEVKAWNYLKKYCELKLAAFPTTLEEDEKLLATNLNFIEKNICRVKICDKKIYTFWI
jgi:hypothetical protein